MKKILVPIDGSGPSLNALKAALELARGDSGVALHVISVQPPIASGNVKRFISEETLAGYYHDEGEKALVDARSIIAQSGVAAQVGVQVGPVAQTIAQYAHDNGCGHIIMGTRGLGNVSGLLLGSVATKVLSLVDIPVTLVK